MFRCRQDVTHFEVQAPDWSRRRFTPGALQDETNDLDEQLFLLRQRVEVQCVAVQHPTVNGRVQWKEFESHLTLGTWELNPTTVPHFEQQCTPLVRSAESPRSSVIVFLLDDPWDSGGQHGRSVPNPPYGTSSGFWVILPWRLGYEHEFTGTQAVRRNSSPECVRDRVRCRPGPLLWECARRRVEKTSPKLFCRKLRRVAEWSMRTHSTTGGSRA